MTTRGDEDRAAPSPPGPFARPGDADLDEVERAAWLDFNRTAEAPGDHPSRLLPWLAQAARDHSDLPAVSADGLVLTYAALHERADALATYLRGSGVGAGDTVAVVATRTVVPYPALLAVISVGAAYVPLNPHDPTDRLRLMLEDCGASTVLSDVSSAPKLQALTGLVPTCAVLDEGGAMDGWQDWSGVPAAYQPAPPVEATAGTGAPEDTTAYVIYTSGTTGRPKGVRVAESSLLNLVRWFHDRHGTVAGDRVAQNAPLTFDPSVQQIFPAWTAGACLVVMPDVALLDSYELLVWLQEEEITHLDMVTSHWFHMLDAAVSSPGLRDLPHLRWTLVGGESFTYRSTRQWYDVVRSPGLLNNVYGPTEATVNATHIVVPPERTEGKVPIGKPLPHYRLYVLDDDGGLCPVGEQGELYIAGAGLAQGYCSEEATRKAWLDHCVFGDTTERLYRTGDLARLVRDIDGTPVLEFRGRADRQVKISGYRLELEEVEMAAKACREVRDAAVMTIGDPPTQLVCFVVGGQDGPASLRAEMSERLPAYMVPHIVLPVGSMPFTPSGKLDRDRLLEHLDQVRASQAVPGRSLTATEQMVADVLSRVLRVPVTSPTADFYLLGGSSLLALQVAGLLRDSGEPVRATDLLEHSTVEHLAAHLDRERVVR
ncbi:amino acid adenylation domain-containing protein [Nocardioides sp. InS609-2]|uniref:amino acid adenylation domain-containing protein n=1 Tax=Nocardioides sp. InS609-2 TaxID=2760705 RepID=UPI0020BE490D|nr:amino acid adenylation domain-containing protein [Nocardioides sp. InS609-2]